MTCPVVLVAPSQREASKARVVETARRIIPSASLATMVFFAGHAMSVIISTITVLANASLA